MVKNVDINLIGTPGYPELVAQLGVVSPMIYDPVKLRNHQQQLVAGAVNILCDVNQLTQSDAQWLLALPQYQTVYLEVPKNLSIQNVLTQIGAADYSQLDLTEIRMALNQDFFIGQRSYRILPQSVIRINERFTGAIDWQGTSSVQLTGTFSADREDKQLLIQFPEKPIQVQKYQSGFFYSNQMLSPGYTYRVAPAQEVTGDVDWCLTFNFADKHNRHQSIQINQNQPFLTVPQSDAAYVFYTVLLSASGTGRITFRGIDMTLMRTSGTLVSGDQETALALGDAVHSYYYPGTQSIKPKKLIVTFAGFRAFVRKFELVGAFQKVGQPFLAFTDFRAHGGAFYMNRFETTAYEERVKAIILERLSALGLTTDDLIMTGQSMGSTAAIYYGALLNAGNVVVTKPIINLGTFTSKGDLAITEGVSWMFETRRLLTGRVSVMDQDWLNALVTTAVAQSERKTIYSLFALLEDQYDGDSIDEFVQSIETTGQLGEYFWEHGRHTEKSGAATVWLFDQIQNIIQGDDKR